MGKGKIALSSGLMALVVVCVYLLKESFTDQARSVNAEQINTAATNGEASIAGDNSSLEESADSTDTEPSPSDEYHADIPAAPNRVGDSILVFGRVSDNDNSPLADVSVVTRKGFHKTVTNNSGRYRLPIQIPRDSYQGLIFLRSGYQARRISILKKQMEHMNEIELDAVLEPTQRTVSVSGVLRNEEGQTIEGERVKLLSRALNAYYFALTNGYGEFYFDGVRVDHRYSLEVDRTPSYQEYSLDKLNVTHNTPPLEIVLQAIHFGRLSGNIVDSDGAPVPNLPMQVLSSTVADEEYSILSDGSGFFELEAIPSGTLQIVHRANPHFKVSGIVLEPASHQHVLIHLDMGQHLVEGRVADNDGAPVAEARVTLTGLQVSGELEYKSNRWLSTDSGGYFSFDRVGDGMHGITVQAKGHRKSETKFPVGRSSASIHIVLLPSSDNN
ncbi:MAG: carboxypeptidase-like regulatory domain-containing protein [Gammaproteobacteria bacterium]